MKPDGSISDDVLAQPPMSPAMRRLITIRNLPAVASLLAIGLIYYIISGELSIGPRGLILALIIALSGALILAIRMQYLHVRRSLGVIILVIVTASEAISTSALVASLLTAGAPGAAELPHQMALSLLRDAALIWLVNVLTFAFWYWELDGGGPAQRHHHGYASRDLVFPQVTLAQPGDAPWTPHFTDYMFLAFNTSTAFSPTDTLVLSRRAKLLMMTQSLISLTLLAIIAARAINTL
jgi:uncharacterized membrane protein